MSKQEKSKPKIATQETPASISDPRRFAEHKPVVILLSSMVLMLTWKYFGSAEFYADSIADRVNLGDSDSFSAFYQFSSCLVLLGLVPALIVKLVFREKLSDYGCQLGNRLFTLRSFLILAPIFALFGYIGAMNPALRESFPVNKQAGLATPFFLHVFTYVLFYVGWEFHFRSFLQFGLSGSMGRTGAILIQTMASSLLHIGQPATESFAAIGAGLLWGFLAFRTKSIVSGLGQHIVIGVTVDAAIVYSLV